MAIREQLRKGVNLFRMKTHLLLFEGYVSFEIMLASYFMKTQGEIVTVALDRGPLRSYEGLSVNPDTLFTELNPAEVELLIIPGGDVTSLLDRQSLFEWLRALDRNGSALAAICAGTLLLGKAGVLAGRSFTTNAETEMRTITSEGHYMDSNVVVDGRLVTAKAQGYVDFGIELGKVMEIYSGPEDLAETIEVFKYFGGSK